MNEITRTPIARVGVDLAKRVLQVHAVDAAGRRLVARALTRDQFIAWCATLSLNVQGVLRDVQQAFYGLCVNAGKQVLAAMMEADRVALCGAKNVPDAGRKAVRGGTTRSSVVLGGQRIAVAKPRARSLQHGELELPTFAWAVSVTV